MTAFAGVDAQKRVQRAEDDGRGEHRDEVQESSGSVEGGAQTPEGEVDEKAHRAMGKSHVGFHVQEAGGLRRSTAGANTVPAPGANDCPDFAGNSSTLGSIPARMRVRLRVGGWF